MVSRRLRSLRAHGLGFGLFWAMPLAMLSGLPTIDAPSSDWLAFVWVQQLALVVAVPCVATLLARWRGGVPTLAPLVAGALLVCAAFLYVRCFALGHSTPALSVATGVLAGTAFAVHFLLWQVVYANEGQANSTVYLPCSSAFAVLLCLALSACPPLVVEVALVAVVPFAEACALVRCLGEMEPIEPRRISGHLRVVCSDVWKPVVCATAVCFAWSLSSHVPSLYDAGLVVAMFAGLGCASLAVAGIGLVAGRRFGVQSAYQVLFPLIGIVLFVPALFGEGWLAFQVGFLAFGGRMMTLLSLMLASAYASRTQFSPLAAYLLCAFPTQVGSLVGDSVGFALVAGPYVQPELSLHVAVICLVVCAAVLAVALLGGRARSLAEPADDSLLINPERDEGEGRIGLRGGSGETGVQGPGVGDAAPPSDAVSANSLGFGLTPREAEVVELLLKGHTIAAVSDRLCISENTTRGRMKSIYRKLDIHSRQELVNLFEGRG